jgi:regulator of replication initiation timing
MRLTPIQFLNALSTGKTEKELNRKESDYIDPVELKKLTSAIYGHTIESATDHLLTDYSDGFTICSCCGSYYHSGNGFTKHLSNGCLNCEGETKHRVYHVNASKPSEGGFPSRWMSQMFDDGMHYCKDELQIGKFSKYVNKNSLQLK